MLCTLSCTGGVTTLYRTSFVSSAGSRVLPSSSSVRKPVARLDRLPALAADLVRSKPDLIVAFSPQPSRAAKDATSEIPIVMLFVADPVGVGLVSSLARPGGNLTGVATLVPRQVSWERRLMFFESCCQERSAWQLLSILLTRSVRLLFPKEAPSAAVKLGFQLDVIDVREAGEIPGAIATAKAQGAEALWIVGDPIFTPRQIGCRTCGAGRPTIDLLDRTQSEQVD